MAGFEKEEIVRGLDVVEKIGLRFGSTRGLSEFLFVLLVYGVVHAVPDSWKWGLALGCIRSLLGLFSYHRKPHIDQKASS